MNMVNTALQTAFDTLCAFCPGVFENPSVCVAPYLDFDSTTNRVILHAEQTRYDETYTSIANAALSKDILTNVSSTCLLVCRTHTCQGMAT